MTIEHKQEYNRTVVETVLVILGVILFLIFLTLWGCASSGMVSVIGPEVAAPEGYIYYCRRNPTADECGK